MTLKQIAFKNLLRRKAKAAFILAGLVIGVATVVAVISFTETMTQEINHKLEKFGANILIVPHTDSLALSYGGITFGGVSFDLQPIRHTELSKIATIKNAANIAAVGPMVLGTVHIKGIDVSMAGIDLQATSILRPWWKIDGHKPTTDGLMPGAEAARILDLSIGDVVPVNGRDMKVTGLLAPTGSQDDRLLFTALETAQSLLGKEGEISIAEVAAMCHNCPVDEMARQISDILPSANVMAIQQVVKGRMETLAQFKKSSYGISIVVLLIGGLVVLVTLMGSVRERTGEIGILLAVGFRKSHILRIILMEAGAISALAGLSGYIIGIGGVGLGLRLAGKADTALRLDPLLAAGAIAVALVLGLAASAYPAALAARLDPNQALKRL